MERISRHRRFNNQSPAEVFAPCLNDISSLSPSLLFDGGGMDGRDQREIMFGRVSREQSRFLWMASSLADNFVFGEFCGKEVDRLRFWPRCGQPYVW